MAVDHQAWKQADYRGAPPPEGIARVSYAALYTLLASMAHVVFEITQDLNPRPQQSGSQRKPQAMRAVNAVANAQPGLQRRLEGVSDQLGRVPLPVATLVACTILSCCCQLCCLWPQTSIIEQYGHTLANDAALPGLCDCVAL